MAPASPDSHTRDHGGNLLYGTSARARLQLPNFELCAPTTALACRLCDPLGCVEKTEYVEGDKERERKT